MPVNLDECADDDVALTKINQSLEYTEARVKDDVSAHGKKALARLQEKSDCLSTKVVEFLGVAL